MLAAKTCLYASYPVLLIYTSSVFITFNVSMPCYDSRYGPKFFRKGTGVLVADSLILILVLSIMNFGLFLISS